MSVGAILRRPGVGPLLAVASASVLAAAFFAWAAFGSATTSCSADSSGPETCVEEPLVHGTATLAAAAPLAICLVVWWLLHRYCSRGGRAPRWAAVGLTGAFVAFTTLAIASIGVLLVPMASLLVAAVATTKGV